MPPPPTPSFLELCKTEKLVLPTTIPAMKKFLEDASIGKPFPTSRADLLELCATVLWPRDYLAKKEDPEAWATKIPDALFAKLRALYPIPPKRATSTFGDSIYARVAEAISLFAPDDMLVDSSGVAIAAGGPSQAQGPINTARPDAAATSSPAPALSSPSPSTPSSSGTAASASSTPLTSAGTKRKLLMHDDLRAVLEDDVYHALDASTGLSATERTRLHKACRDGSLGVLLDNTTSAAFGHQFILALTDGSHFHTGKRGLALAIAGRSAAASTAVVDFMESMTRDAFLRTLRDHWVAMLPAFAGDHELSGTIVNRLWEGVTFTMKVRAARASAWGVPEIADACARQYQGLPAYRVAIAATLARASSAYAGTAVARHINRAYLEFFLPFWWEHILLRGQLDADKVNAEVRALMFPPASPAADPPAYPAAPLPPVPPPAPPPPPPAPPAAPAVPIASPTQPKPPLYVAKPCSALIVGPALGLARLGPGRPCACAINAAFPGRQHRTFECPLRYHQVRGRCPGWTPAGSRVPACWTGDDLTPACRDEWRDFAATLEVSRASLGAQVNF
jgi:hypothetical protein